MSLLSRLGDRCNPILVREVRQAMRSRMFTASFVVLIVLAVVLTCLMLAAHLEPPGYHSGPWEPGPFGGVLFLGVYGCLALAVLGFVPLGAFLAMAEEWNARTWEQLSLSGLTPGRIVRGRLLAAMVQAVLFASALVPFLAASFLLHGLDLNVMLIGLAWLVLLCPTFVLVATALGALYAPRHARILLLVLLIAAAFGVGMLMGAFMEELIRKPSTINQPEFRWSMIAGVLFAVVLATYSGLGASALLTHPSENRSTPLRITSLVVMTLGVVAIAWMYNTHPESAGPYVIAAGGLFAFWIPAALFATESDGLSRRMAGKVSPNRFLALLSAPLLPGGGRGFLYLLLVAVPFAAAAAAVYIGMPSKSMALPRIGCGSVLGALLSVICFTGLPAGIFSFFRQSLPTRLIAFATIVVVAALGTITHLSFYSYYRNDFPFSTLLNPFALSAIYWETSWAGRESMRWLYMTMIGLSAAAIILNTPRMLRGVREVLVASAAARAKLESTKG